MSCEIEMMWILGASAVLLAVFELSVPFNAISACTLESDFIRKEYLKAETLLWEEIVNNKNMKRNDKLRKFYSHNQKFINSNINNTIDLSDLISTIRRFDLSPLHIEVINVHQMFVLFEQHINREADLSAESHFNEKDGMVLVEHILNDQNFPLKVSFEQLNQILLRDKLFIDRVIVKLKESCDIHRSAHQVMHQLYNAVGILQLKVYLMIQSSFMLLNIYEKGETAKINNFFKSYCWSFKYTYVHISYIQF